MNGIIKLSTAKNPFKSLCVPPFGGEHPDYIISHKEIPTKLEFNKTYYTFMSATNELRAFRVLALAVTDCCGELCALVQYPNSEPIWVGGLFKKPIFETKEEYLNYAVSGSGTAELGWESFARVYPHYRYASVIGFRDKCWKWAEGQAKPVYNPKIEYFFINEEGTFACVSDGYYISREECIKDNLNGVRINEFADEPVVIKTIILPATQKIHTLRFIED